jgi:hypothetical protein
MRLVSFFSPGAFRNDLSTSKVDIYGKAMFKEERRVSSLTAFSERSIRFSVIDSL